MPSWVIVGASRGIGYAYLQVLARDPSNLVIGLVRTPAPTIEKLKLDGLSSVHILPADMSDHASLTSAASAVAALTPSVDHLVINGAYLSVASYPLTGPDYVGKEDLFLSELHSAMQTNAAGTLFSMNAFMPLILKSEVKKIVAISSAGGDIDAVRDMDMADALPYALSKAGVNMLVAKYALKYRAQGVVVVAMNPGFVYTLSESLDTIPAPAKPIIDNLVEKFKHVDPEFQRPMMPTECAEIMVRTIGRFGMGDSGRFVGHRGDRRWV